MVLAKVRFVNGKVVMGGRWLKGETTCPVGSGGSQQDGGMEIGEKDGSRSSGLGLGGCLDPCAFLYNGSLPTTGGWL